MNESAQVIPDESRFPAVNAVAECGDCGWRGRARRWWSDAQADADRHNRTSHRSDEWKP